MKITHSTILAAVVLGTAAVSTHAADLAMRGVQRNENVDRRLDPSSGDEKEEKCDTECKDGALYYQFYATGNNGANYAGDSGWIDALEKPPRGCIFAPVTSEADAKELAVAANNRVAWVGAYKDFADLPVFGTVKLDKWKNFFGDTKVPETAAIWSGATRPNNNSPGETRVLINSISTDGKLNDVPLIGYGSSATGAVTGAMFQCCAEQQCYNSGHGRD